MSRNASTVSRADIEAKLREIRDTVIPTVEQAGSSALAVAGAVLAVGLVVLAYLSGRRKGRKRNTIVEIRRV
ncbi:MAG: hypothetical protein ACRDV9_11875 [Acidimicrobiia bacterium]